MLQAIPDTVLDVPFQYHLAGLVEGRLGGVDLGQNIFTKGMSSSIIRSMACTWPMIFFSRRCRLSASIHCLTVRTSCPLQGTLFLLLSSKQGQFVKSCAAL